MTCQCEECTLRRRVDFISDNAPAAFDLDYLTVDGAVFRLNAQLIRAFDDMDYCPPLGRNAYLNTRHNHQVFIPSEDLDEVFSAVRRVL